MESGDGGTVNTAARHGGRTTPTRPPGGPEADTAVHWVLRLGAAACFVGHGAFGILTKQAWVPYFALWGFPEAWAWKLMPVVGVMDVSIGVLTLFRPLPAVLLWMVFWGFQTACLRPLAGEPIWELLERAGNFGVPLALLWTRGWPTSWRGWFTPLGPPALDGPRARQIGWILRVTTAALLVGHGGFGAFMHKPEWTGYFGTIGIGSAAVARHALVDVAGWFEIGLGLAILVRPWPGLLILAFVWKLGTEWLRPLAGEPLWEFIERGGSYAAPLALFWLSRRPAALRKCQGVPVTP
jgi:hypothetical protein